MRTIPRDEIEERVALIEAQLREGMSLLDQPTVAILAASTDVPMPSRPAGTFAQLATPGADE